LVTSAARAGFDVRFRKESSDGHALDQPGEPWNLDDLDAANLLTDGDEGAGETEHGMNGHGAHQCTLQPIGDAQAPRRDSPRRGCATADARSRRAADPRRSPVRRRHSTESGRHRSDRSRRDGRAPGAGVTRHDAIRGPEGRERALDVRPQLAGAPLLPETGRRADSVDTGNDENRKQQQRS